MKNYYKIEWNNEKCDDAINCGRCLEVCPEAVFAIYAPNREEGISPEEYVISPAMQFFCNGCGACLEACPKDALKVTPKSNAQ
ncbi:MAG: ATP-binding protein [Candidatus Thorarchaeota archaeon]